MTIAPFSFPRNLPKSSFVFASKYTTVPPMQSSADERRDLQCAPAPFHASRSARWSTAPASRWSGRTRGIWPPSTRSPASIAANPSVEVRSRLKDTRDFPLPDCDRGFRLGSGHPPPQSRSLHLPPAVPILHGLRPIRVPLQTQKGPLAVRSFALPCSIQPIFRNEMLCLRTANSTRFPSWPRGPLSGLVLLDVRSVSLRFVVFQRLSALTVISHFFSAISQRSAPVPTPAGRLCV